MPLAGPQNGAESNHIRFEPHRRDVLETTQSQVPLMLLFIGTDGAIVGDDVRQNFLYNHLVQQTCGQLPLCYFMARLDGCIEAHNIYSLVFSQVLDGLLPKTFLSTRGDLLIQLFQGFGGHLSKHCHCYCSLAKAKRHAIWYPKLQCSHYQSIGQYPSPTNVLFAGLLIASYFCLDLPGSIYLGPKQETAKSSDQ